MSFTASPVPTPAGSGLTHPATGVVRQGPQGIPGPVGPMGPAGPIGQTPSLQTFAITILFVGQTVIPLPVPPLTPSSVRLIIRGFAYAAPDFTVSTTSLTWDGPFSLEPADAVTLSYF